MAIVRKQRRVDGKKQNYYWDDALCIEVEPPERKQRSDNAEARAWRLGMPVQNCSVISAVGPVHPVLHRLRGETLKLKGKVKAIPDEEVQIVQQALYSRMDVVQGLSSVQRQQVLSTIQQLSSPTLRYIPDCWEEFRYCAEAAVNAVESNHNYTVELLTIDSILEEQLEAKAAVVVDTVLSKYIEPERLNIDMSELPF